MANLDENQNLLGALSDALAATVENVGASVVRVNGGRRRSASGVAYAPDMVLTASHALEGEEDLSVTAHDGSTFQARLVGRDHSTDLALLAVESLQAETVLPAEGEPRVGQLALAVGSSPRGVGTKVSLGVVSATGGPMRVGRWARIERFIQTDATSYRGLSGGPLVDARGNVLGILTSGWSRNATLAVPADTAWRVAKALESRGSVKRGYLGILSQPVLLPEAQKFGLSQNSGLLVAGVEQDSPAGRGGLLIGDILAALDGQTVEDTDDLLALLTGEKVGQGIQLKVIRGGELKDLDITVGERAQRS